MPRRRGNGKTSAITLRVAQRRHYVVSLRRTGASYGAILQAARRHFGAELPPTYNRSKVYADVLHELQQAQLEQTKDLEALRALELERLDQLQFALYPLALGKPADLATGAPPIPPDLEAIRQVLAIQARRARYLPGLEGPLHVAPTTPDGTQPYQPHGAAEPSATFFQELAVLFQQLGPQHLVADGLDGRDESDGRADPLARW
jgi:hypothetical protein